MSAAEAPEVWLAPAKLNLFLHVVGRRDDGYHELQTVFRFLDHGDRLRFRVRDDGRVERPEGQPGLSPEDDLVVRAARLLQRESGCRLGVDIAVEKHVPAGAGLGGGSSDAATTLLALDRLWGLELGRDRLSRIGLSLGADVPVFVGGRSAWAEGVGERLRPITLPEATYLVVVPGVHVSTPAVFAAPDLVRDHAPVSEADLWEGRVANDLEPVATRLHPEVGQVLAWLRDRGPARMSGSGGACFAEVASVEAGRALLAELPPTLGASGFVARGLDVHPHYEDGNAAGPTAARPRAARGPRS
ncbi:MAG: 4-(cytidine 5'-diphospho)-2-C-methyl-D-erythritol kinase [Myxococcota bacterium]|nr:4-(cytidine 5'-diphospho)-2-C-methyl-D-erythritol kinase [Myxococcota bacterium]